MKTIHYSTRFKKDIKRYANRQDVIDVLKGIVECLKRDIPIPSKHKPHRLKGNYRECWECHIGNDYLLIWVDMTASTVSLERIGTHHELFGK
mgnify:FL=1